VQVQGRSAATGSEYRSIGLPSFRREERSGAERSLGEPLRCAGHRCPARPGPAGRRPGPAGRRPAIRVGAVLFRNGKAVLGRPLPLLPTATLCHRFRFFPDRPVRYYGIGSVAVLGAGTAAKYLVAEKIRHVVEIGSRRHPIFRNHTRGF